MHRRDMLKFTAAALALAGCSSEPTRPRRRKILFFTKSSTFEHPCITRGENDLSEAEKIAVELGAKLGFDITATKDGTVFDGEIGQYDAFMFFTTGNLLESGKDQHPPMTAAGKQKLLDAVASGKGFVGSHCAADTFHSEGERFQNNPKLDPYIEMLGGEFIKHGVQQEAEMVVSSPKFPGLKDAGKSFRLMEEWYSLKNFAKDLHVILIQNTDGMEGTDYERPPYPATWARMHGKGRVFYTSLGHREDVWANELFQDILFGGLGWVCRDAEADIAANIEKVTPGASVMPPEPPPKKPAT